MPISTKEKMVAGAADLMSRRGVHATSLREVVHHTGTPRGSLAHHFPGGKQQMLEEALRYATEAVAQPLQSLLEDKGAVAGLQAFVGWWRRVLGDSDFQSGCPVLAVAVEPLTEEGEARERLRGLAQAAFERWQAVLVTALVREGISQARAHRLAALVVASIEGTVAMCRTARSMQPLDNVYRELESLLKTAIDPT
ncbi:MAG: TetR/AcrR family transcriptional regulator [Ramlibacter sp.]|nr:TetR/AcrR family transcriptional regulator [Ramlibacter sp.]